MQSGVVQSCHGDENTVSQLACFHKCFLIKFGKVTHTIEH